MGIVVVTFLAASREQHRHLEPDQFGRELGELIERTQRPSVLDGDVLAINPAMLPQPFTECVGECSIGLC